MRRWGPRPPRRLRVRPLRRGETEVIEAVFAGMTPASRTQRFHAPVQRLSERAVRALAAVDGRRHIALVAEAREHGRWRAVGIVRLADIADGSAEIAIAVVDDHQGRGVARRLLVELGDRARDLGVTALTGTIRRDNEPAQRLLRSLFPDARVRTDGGVVEFVAPVAAGRGAPVIDVADVLADLGAPVAA